MDNKITIKQMQIKNSFDKETIIKILKGASISATGAFSLYLLDFAGTVDFTNTSIAALAAFAIPFLTNVVKEFMSGV